MSNKNVNSKDVSDDKNNATLQIIFGIIILCVVVYCAKLLLDTLVNYHYHNATRVSGILRCCTLCNQCEIGVPCEIDPKKPMGNNFLDRCPKCNFEKCYRTDKKGIYCSKCDKTYHYHTKIWKDEEEEEGNQIENPRFSEGDESECDICKERHKINKSFQLKK
jgi:hypothetical protein